ncbi:hypothetical protein JW979_12050 [bacterium]|nr:hypothetical protein [candidate division CSSED10-310 bacterium]
MKRKLMISAMLLYTAVGIAHDDIHELNPVSAFLADFERAVQSKQLNKIMECFSADNPEFFRDQNTRYDIFCSTENSSFSMRVKQAGCDPSGNSALVFISRRTIRHDRPFLSAYWAKLDIIQDDLGYKISGERILDYARAENTILTMTIDPENHILSGQSHIQYLVTETGPDNLVLSLNRGLDITKITDDNGKPIAFERTGTTIVVPFTHTLTLNSKGQLIVKYSGGLFNESQEIGYSQVNIGFDGSFASWVTRWYPVLNCETTKSKGTIEYTIPPNMIVVSSGKRLKTIDQGDSKRVIFEVNSPMEYSFAAADYIVRSRTIDGVDIGVYFLGDDERNADEYISTCGEMIAFLKATYGFYPFDQYAVVEIPKSKVGTLGGSSEQGMNLFPEGKLPEEHMNEYVICHEIGHSWWGNLVGGEVGISEALAQFTSTLWFEQKYGEKALRSLLNNGYTAQTGQYANAFFENVMMNPGYDVPLGIPSPEKQSILHNIADIKGHFVYHMLRDHIGADAFMEGLKSILNNYRYKNVTLKEMKEAFETAGGCDLDWFYDQWFYGTGAPEFFLDYDIKEVKAGYEVFGKVSQSDPFFRVRLEIAAMRGDEIHLESMEITKTPQHFSFTVPFKPEKVELDPFLKIFRWTPERKAVNQLKLASKLTSVHQFEKAEEIYTLLMKRLPDSCLVAGQYGDFLLARGSVKDARKVFDKALAEYESRSFGVLDPQYGKIRLSLAKIMDLTGKRVLAVNQYREIMNDPMIRNEVKLMAKHYLDEPFCPETLFIISQKELEEYTGNYKIQEMVFMGSIDDNGILVFTGPDGVERPLIPKGIDEFEALDDVSMRIRFERNPNHQISRADLYRNGDLFISLEK